jgi:dTDP-4-dehydrorhamnose reductase
MGFRSNQKTWVKAMKILITGASGFLGEKLFSIFSSEYEVVGTYLKGEKTSLYKLDLTDKKAVDNLVEKIRPDIVINTAGITDVDYCEENPENAKKISSACIKNLVETCLKYRCKLVHISTDYVFDGEKGDYKEDDKPNPINVYGKMKLEEENVIISSKIEHIISRVAVLYGYNSNSDKQTFTNWVIKKLKSNEEIKIINDQYTTPTLIDDIAESLKNLIELKRTGIYHIVGSECINRYDFAIKIAEIFNLKNLIKPITSKDIKWRAKRPMNSCLNTDKLKKLGIKMSNINEGLIKMKNQMGIL